MEPISTALAGIALVKASVDGIKSAIGTAKDIGEIAGFIDKLFEGEKQVQQQRSKKSGVSSLDGIGDVANRSHKRKAGARTNARSCFDG